ncbi:hypothetical protein NBRC10512_005967 [Rhodotorula toruloides]|uniref:Large ribosomal subunit protein mL43 n=2 Tax=Rhodotorula toruloides TaxID=5286 RepID=A0A061AG12_RHOTO|nr:mitochondrial ribosomal protein subunit L51 [Rhodotorula toruloides NP11]EMS22052.1 mitochondrial ribosomal protein subunit L51 [Rhodotorula toruloides NP11]KAJ8296248.1 54S ribosomal protein L51, mitochondrial [Rhodotorula toruloides]CDR36450.1 RHTO0S02e02300g1_1 [Rhodotorula toruloides]
MSPRILRSSLSAPLPSTAPSSRSAFILPCKKLVVQYSEIQGSNRGMRDFIGQGLPVDIARRYPGVEVVVERREAKHPVLRGVYNNGRTKEICVRNLPPNSILAKAQLLLDSSGQKIVSIKRPGVVSTTESVRGVWSAFHDEVRQAA